MWRFCDVNKIPHRAHFTCNQKLQTLTSDPWRWKDCIGFLQSKPLNAALVWNQSTISVFFEQNLQLWNSWAALISYKAGSLGHLGEVGLERQGVAPSHFQPSLRWLGCLGYGYWCAQTKSQAVINLGCREMQPETLFALQETDKSETWVSPEGRLDGDKDL